MLLGPLAVLVTVGLFVIDGLSGTLISYLLMRIKFGSSLEAFRMEQSFNAMMYESVHIQTVRLKRHDSRYNKASFIKHFLESLETRNIESLLLCISTG
jgi:hypothetical protein